MTSDSSSLLFVATDRISAYDVIMQSGIPHKGALLTQLTAHWFSLFATKIPDLKTHLVSTALPATLSEPLGPELKAQLALRSMVVRKLKIFPLESIVRGYLTGSGWAEYKKSGTVHGIQMPTGLQESQKLEQPLWTPSTKAEVGGKDENISPEKARELVGEKYAKKIEELSLKVYQTVSLCISLILYLAPSVESVRMGTNQMEFPIDHVHRRGTTLQRAGSSSPTPSSSLDLTRLRTRSCLSTRS